MDDYDEMLVLVMFAFITNYQDRAVAAMLKKKFNVFKNETVTSS